ncbi:MAG: N-acetyl sugar amidotransferase [Bacteroidales bacterium]|jgi:N-acetyl sugar amidotransferase|nr:N-acetyl sugar amidotransferase [Bacteroidales bacterium]
MDTSDPDITFDENGYCNHCTRALAEKSTLWFPNEEGEKKLKAIVDKIKIQRKGNDYDCIIGLSGGVDSSFLAYKAVQYGLKPLVVHVDCGWNSELAVKNIENIVKYLNLELHTYVVNWEEMKDLQLAFFRSNVANQDIPQDHAIFAALYKFAVKNNVSYVLNGSNFATESILPVSWGYNALDYRQIKGIYKAFGNKKMKTYPHVTFFQRYVYFTFIKKMRVLKMLNYLPYDKEKAIKIMSDELGWRYYGGKHHESRFTKFFQAHFLPAKFGYDKRRSHLSSLIVSGFMTREQALKEMKKEIYSPQELEDDIQYIAKKLDITPEELKNIISNGKNKTYKDYPNNEQLFSVGINIRNALRKLTNK